MIDYYLQRVYEAFLALILLALDYIFQKKEKEIHQQKIKISKRKREKKR